MGKSSPFDHDLDGHRDFDFLHGIWNVHNRRLTARFQNSTEWETFEATARVSPVLDGVGHIDEVYAVMPDGSNFAGLTLRLFDPQSRLWSLYWSDSHSCRLFPPLVGRFRDGIGHFHGSDSEGGKPVKVRFTWSVLTPDSARWQQAMSLDDGQTWEENWEMLLTRTSS